jgi:hypothetical protein
VTWHTRVGLWLVAVALAILVAAAMAEMTEADELAPEHVEALIVDRAVAHGVDPAALLETAYCESRFRPSARGRLGEYGLFQWLPPDRRNAWGISTAARMGISIAERYEAGDPDAPYYDADAAAELFAMGAAVRRTHWRATYGRRCR